MILRLSENFIKKYKNKNLYVYKPANLYIDYRSVPIYTSTDVQ